MAQQVIAVIEAQGQPAGTGLFQQTIAAAAAVRLEFPAFVRVPGQVGRKLGGGLGRGGRLPAAGAAGCAGRCAPRPGHGQAVPGAPAHDDIGPLRFHAELAVGSHFKQFHEIGAGPCEGGRGIGTRHQRITASTAFNAHLVIMRPAIPHRPGGAGAIPAIHGGIMHLERESGAAGGLEGHRAMIHQRAALEGRQEYYRPIARVAAGAIAGPANIATAKPAAGPAAD